MKKFIIFSTIILFLPVSIFGQTMRDNTKVSKTTFENYKGLLGNDTDYLKSYTDRIALSTGTVNRPMTLVVGFTKDCDYICDGADDYVQAQQAADALEAFGGGIVFFREGIYDFDSDVINSLHTEVSSTTFMGVGDATVIVSGGDGQGIRLRNSNCKVMNLLMTTKSGVSGTSINITSPTCTIQNCTFIVKDELVTALMFINAPTTKIVDNRFIDTAVSGEPVISINGGADDSYIGQNTIQANYKGIDVVDCDDVMIIGNRIIAPTGIIFDGASAVRTMVFGNNFEGCTDEITDAAAGTNIRIRGNIDKNGAWLAETDDFDMGGNTILDGVYQGDGSALTGVGLATSTVVTTDGRAGENLTKAEVVYISGATGTKAQFKKADFDSSVSEVPEAVGVAAETKNNGQAILIRNFGVLTGIDMSDFSAGDEIWLWEDGQMTNVQPSSGVVVHVGHALNNLGSPNGALLVHHETPVTGVYGQVGHPAIIRMGDGDVISFRDGQNNQIANMTQSSMTFKSGYWVYFSSAYIYELWVSSLRGLSSISILAPEVNLAGGAMNILNGDGAKASSYIRVHESDKLALVISSSPDIRPLSNDPADSRYSLAITSDGVVYPRKIVFPDGTVQVSSPPAGAVNTHSASWHLTGNMFTSSTTDKGLYQYPIPIAGTVSDIFFKFGTAPTEAWTLRFKDTPIISSSYDNVFGTVTFTVNVDSANISGLSYSMSEADVIGIDMYDVLYSSNCGSNLGITIKLTE